MKQSIVAEKSFNFALRIIELHRHLIDEQRAYELGKQVLRSGTSIGANIEEALGGFSERDFAAKVSISYKESRETAYWLRLFKASKMIEEKWVDSLLADCNELTRMTASIVKTMKDKREN